MVWGGRVDTAVEGPAAAKQRKEEKEEETVLEVVVKKGTLVFATN